MSGADAVTTPASDLQRPSSIEPSGKGGAASSYPDSPWADRRSKVKLFTAIALLLLLPPIAAGMLSSAQPEIYAAEADVLYRGGGSSDAQSIERELATQQVLLQSRPLIEEAAEIVGRSPKEVAEAVSVDVLEQSSVLRVHVEDQEPRVAQQIATSLVEQYIAMGQQESASSATAEQERQLLQEQVDALNARLAEITTRTSELVDIPVPSAAVQLELRTLEAEGQNIRGRLAALQTRILDAELRAVEEERGDAEIFAPASVMDDPVAPQPLRAAAAGALLGLALSLALVALLRFRHERSRPPTT